MRLPRLSPSVERPRPGAAAAAVPSAEIRPQHLCVIKACGMACGPGGRCPAECPRCVNGACQAG